MASEETQFQLVTFQLGNELYGVNIMDVKEIVRLQNVRVIPNSPYYVEGIINLRGEIIPIIDLHKRFRIQALEKEEMYIINGYIPHENLYLTYETSDSPITVTTIDKIIDDIEEWLG